MTGADDAPGNGPRWREDEDGAAGTPWRRELLTGGCSRSSPSNVADGAQDQSELYDERCWDAARKKVRLEMGGLRLGRIFGIPIQLSFSFLLLLAAIVIWQGVQGAMLLAIVFVSVLLHELGHAFAARRFGVAIFGIELHFFGGAARMAELPRKPRAEVLIAGAGPAVSLSLSLLALAASTLSGWPLLRYVALVNLLLGAFNLLPALPMDGGRILRALLSPRMGRYRATVIAVKIARVVSGGLALFALHKGGLFLIALAVVIWLMASAELRMAELQSFAEKLFGGSPFAGQAVSGDSRAAAAGRGGAAGVWTDEEGSVGEVEVLGRDGQTAGSSARRGAAARGGFPDGVTVEEQQNGARRRWVLRGPDGQILFISEQPLRW